MIIDSMEVALKFVADNTTLNKFIKSIGELNFNAVLSAAGLSGIVKGIEDISTATQNTLQPFNKLSAMTGESAQNFQAMENGARKFGVSAGVMSNILLKISDAASDMRFGKGPGASWIGLLGTNVLGQGDKPVEMFDKMADFIKDMPLDLQKARLHQATFDDETLLVIQHLSEIEKEATNNNKSFLESWNLLKATNDLSNAWGEAIAALGPTMGPVIETILNYITQFLKWFKATEESTDSWQKTLINVIGALTIIGVLSNGILGTFKILNSLKIFSLLLAGGGIGSAIGVGLAALAGWKAGEFLNNNVINPLITPTILPPANARGYNRANYHVENTYHIATPNKDGTINQLDKYHEYKKSTSQQPQQNL